MSYSEFDMENESSMMEDHDYEDCEMYHPLEEEVKKENPKLLKFSYNNQSLVLKQRSSDILLEVKT